MGKQAEVEIRSTRLTTLDREGIVRRALEAAFAKEKAALEKRESALCTRCYNAVYPASVRKLVAQLPDEWVSTSSRVSFNVGGQHVDLKPTKAIRVPPGSYHRQGTVTDRAIVDAVRAYQGDRDDFDARRKAAEKATEAIVNSCGTTKQLHEVWPQGLPFYQHIAPQQRVQLPAAQIEHVNKMLGLKKVA